MGGEGAALEDELGAVELEVQRLDQRLEPGGGLARAGPDDLVVLPVLRDFDGQCVRAAFDASRGGAGLLGLRGAEEGEREVNLFGGRRAALELPRPARERLGGLRRRPCGEEEPHPSR